MDPENVKRVVIVGAGTMGHSIAQVFARAGIETGLVDSDRKALDRAMNLIKSNLNTLAEFSNVRRDEIPGIIGRIHLSTNLAAACRGADFALEAVVENPEVKKEVFFRLEEYCHEQAVLASNTSSLEVFDIVDLAKPERMVTAHWFAPPHIIPLVEVAPGPKTAPEVVTFTAGLMERIGKKPVVMKKFVRAFIVNRIQQAIRASILEILENDWASPEDIDQAVKASLGIRLPIVGVVQTLDFAGLDLIYDVMKGSGSIHPLIEEKVKQGHLGAKTSRGLYDYGGRSEEEILKKRDERYLKVFDLMESIHAFEPV